MPRSLTPSAVQALIQLQDTFYRRKLEQVRLRDEALVLYEHPGAVVIQARIDTWDAAYTEISLVLHEKGLRNPS